MSIDRRHVSARMSRAVASDNNVYLAGIFANESSGDSVTDQTIDILTQIDELLAESGTNKSRTLTAMIWLKDISTFDEFNAVWDKWVPSGTAPARACVETKFPLDRIKVEIQITARK